MSVMVNEFDVVPAAPKTEPAPPPAAPPPGTADRLSPAAKADLERALRIRAERRQRLEAY
jgi:hypothetical protein